YTVVVTASLQVAPLYVEQRVLSGEAGSRAVTVQLPSGASTVTTRVLSAAPWMQVGALVGGQVTLNFRPWRSGVYSTTLELRSGSDLVLLPISLTVNSSVPERDLTASAGTLSFTTSENATSAPQTVTLLKPSWNAATAVTTTVEYSGTGSGWLQLSDRADGVDVRASAASLGRGNYAATLVFTPELPATVLRVPVALTVGAGLAAPAARTLSVDAESTAATLQATVPVLVAEGAAQAWTAQSSQPWLQLSVDSGTTGDSLAFRVEAAAVAAMDNFGEQRATVTIRSALAHVSPVSFDITLAKRLPEVQHIGPYLAISGRTAALTLRGRGFAGIADIAARLQAGGLSVGGLTRVSDTEVRLSIDPPGAGTLALGFTNALGLAGASATLQVVSPQTHAYAAVPTGGAKRAVVYDAQRRAVYAVNVQNEVLNRFRFDGSAWVLDAASVPAILDAGLGPDGTSLIVTSTPGRIWLLDPVSLATSFTLDVPAGLARNLTYSGYGISTTSDGRSWLPTGSGGWNELGVFDHRTRSFGPRPSQPNFRPSFYSGPWSMISRDGNRMLVVQSGGLSPAPVSLVFDTSSNRLVDNPAGLTYFYEGSLSDDGGRVLIDGYEVRDRDFGLVGRVTLPATPSRVRMGSVLSPDGRRAYVLVYEEAAFGSAPTSLRPKVLVYDSSTADPVTSNLPLVGEIELADYPSCRAFNGGADCVTAVRSTISPDGSTLFFVGDRNLVVVPVPSALRAAGSTADRRAQALRRAPQVQTWQPGTAR
ncbi:MAG: hypothetical protein C0505_18395, partial [Leptothrix sp. (in: Bacteria)]|nr:hypothetical protein [Leptothrix sp. (in: b-proteobacteria)]